MNRCFWGVLTTTRTLAVEMAFSDRRFEVLLFGGIGIFYFCVSLGCFWILHVPFFGYMFEGNSWYLLDRSYAFNWGMFTHIIMMQLEARLYTNRPPGIQDFGAHLKVPGISSM
jgi:hypothetical protein